MEGNGNSQMPAQQQMAAQPQVYVQPQTVTQPQIAVQPQMAAQPQIVAQPQTRKHWPSTPVREYCVVCQQETLTRVRKEPGIVTWVCCFGLGWIGCCCLPFLIGSCQDTCHQCTQCGTKVGRKKALIGDLN